ncbi:MAG: tRNA 2-thiouridine(34) synthase MnmA [Candidatus Omnitrophota bacterium]
MAQENKLKKVAVAMSGGVDSSVAAALMKEQGYEVEGVTMCFNIPHTAGRRPSCCGVEGIQDARSAARCLAIPHHVLDFSGDIEDLIIKDFIQEYCRGRTPNPCVRCNQHLKFGTLQALVKQLGMDYLATGHYARIDRDEQTGRFRLRKGIDGNKDQSYFLYGLAEDALPFILFPLGDLTKTEVRALARRFGLPTSEKPESQDICFVPASGYKTFIREREGEDAFIPGPFKNPQGEVIGQHQGIARYTIGQRDKLGIALGVPVYVYRIAPEENAVYVGPEEYLYAEGLQAGQMKYLLPVIPERTVEVQARIRYNAPDVKGFLTVLESGTCRLVFDKPQKSVTPGQSVVLYQGDTVLGGGVIETSLRPAHPVSS